MSSSLPHVAILMVTYHAEQYLCDCFESLQKTNYPNDKLHVVVVDNASSDTTVK